MPDPVLRVNAKQFDVDGFLARHPELKPSALWREGELKRNQKVETSGFNVPIVEGEDHAILLANLRAALGTLAPVLAELRAQRAILVLDVGVFATDEQPWPSFHLAPGDLSMIAELGLTLEVSFYPKSG